MVVVGRWHDMAKTGVFVAFFVTTYLYLFIYLFLLSFFFIDGSSTFLLLFFGKIFLYFSIFFVSFNGNGRSSTPPPPPFPHSCFSILVYYSGSFLFIFHSVRFIPELYFILYVLISP